MSNQNTMPDSFIQHEEEYTNWVMSGFPGSKSRTINFIEHFIQRDEGMKLWLHQKDAILRVIYSFEIAKQGLGSSYLLRIVTGGGKSLVIASLIAWMKCAHEDEAHKFLLICPNLIVRDRLSMDFVRSAENNYKTVFEKWSIFPDDTMNERISATVLESGGTPQDMLTSEIVISNIQQLYTSGPNTVRNLDFINNKVGNIAIFNDEAHNSVAEEFDKILRILKEKTSLRVDTTATPERADGNYPDSKMVYSFNISEAMNASFPIIKNIIVFQPESRIVEITYTDAMNKRRKLSEISDKEWEEYEKRLKPMQLIMDAAPMKMLLSIALNALKLKKQQSEDKYKPLLFVVTMGIAEAKRAKDALEKEFDIRTLLVTEESSEKERDEAKIIGKKESPYEAVVSVFMLREGWDVAEVSVILLLRKIMSPVFGQQIIGRGLRKVRKLSGDPESLFVIDHPMLNHGWLWKLMNVSRIKQDVRPTDEIEDEPIPPRREYGQTLTNPENIINIKEPKVDSGFQAKLRAIKDKVKEEEPVPNWQDVLNNVKYDLGESVEITAVELMRIKERHLGKQFGTNVNEQSNKTVFSSEQGHYRITIEDVKSEIQLMAKSLLEEYGMGITKLGRLYSVILDHVILKFTRNEPLSRATEWEIQKIIGNLEEIRKNFTIGIVKGIFLE